MTDREHTARLDGEDLAEPKFSFYHLERIVADGLDEYYIDHARTVRRILEKVFTEESWRIFAVRAVKAVLSSAETDDLAIHFSTGTSYRLRLKLQSGSSVGTTSTDVLDTMLQPLPPSEDAARLLRRAQYAMLTPPSRPRFPLKRESVWVGHLAISVPESGQRKGLFRVADPSGANEVYKIFPSGPGKLTDDHFGAYKLHTFAIFAGVDPARETCAAAAIIAPYRDVGFSRTTKVARALTSDRLISLDLRL